jgi:hypothetical protein
LATQEIAGNPFDDIVPLEVCCRSFENYRIVEFVGFQDDIILWMEDLSNCKDFLVIKCTRWPDQPVRQTSEKHILSNTNARRKGSNSVGYTDAWRSMAIHARFINFHVVEYGPDVEPYPLQVSDNKFNMTKGHLDRVELIKDLLEPLDRWLDSRRTSFRWSRLLVLFYAIYEKNNGGSELIISWLTEFP